MEKESMTEIEVLRARISQTKPDDAKLYFVTRILKNSALRRKAVLRSEERRVGKECRL